MTVNLRDYKRDYMRQWRADNPERAREITRNGMRRLRQRQKHFPAVSNRARQETVKPDVCEKHAP
jgi:hypothetical protein